MEVDRIKNVIEGFFPQLLIGYNINDSDLIRRKVLKKAIDIYGVSAIIRDLHNAMTSIDQALKTFGKMYLKYDKDAEIYEKDIYWIDNYVTKQMSIEERLYILYLKNFNAKNMDKNVESYNNSVDISELKNLSKEFTNTLNNITS